DVRRRPAVPVQCVAGGSGSGGAASHARNRPTPVSAAEVHVSSTARSTRDTRNNRGGHERAPARHRRDRTLLSRRRQGRPDIERADLGPSRMRRLTVAALAACACIACGLPSRTRAEAEQTSTAIDAENRDIAQKEAAYRAFLASGAYASYRIYAEREAWAKNFDYARAKTAAAKATYERYVAPDRKSTRLNS